MSSKNNAKKEDLVFDSATEVIEESEKEIQPEVSIENEINACLKEALTDSKALFNLYSKYLVEKNESGLNLLKEKSTEENFKKAVDRYDLIQSANLIKSKILSGEIDVLNLSDEDANVLRRFKNLDIIEKLLSRKNTIHDEISKLYAEEKGIQEKLSGLGITHIGSAKTSKKSGETGSGVTSITKARRSEEKLFIKSLLEEGKYTENQITMKTLEKYPEYSSSAIEAVLRNSKNSKYTVYFVDYEKTKPLTIKINAITKIASISEFKN
jgi:curved DNA-binding protein CbpA